MTDVQVAVGLRRETGDDAVVLAAVDIGDDACTDEISGFDHGRAGKIKSGSLPPGLSTLTESVYEGFLMLQAIATKAKSLDVAKMDAASEGASYQGPRGTVTMRARHVEQDVFVADVTDKGFRVVKTFPRIGAGQTCKV